MSNHFRTTFHRDGSVTYWSVYNQSWRRRARFIPHEELAAMNDGERRRLKRRGSFDSFGWRSRD